MSNEGTTIRSLPELDETRTPQVRRLLDLRAHTAELRDSVTRLSTDADRLHTEVQGADLDERTGWLAQTEPSDLLAAASDELGMSWSLLARLVGVSPTAIRKWRKGSAHMSPENRRHLAHVVAFCEVVRELNPRIIDPTLWLETPLTTTTTLTPADLIAAGYASALLDLASQRISAVDLLNDFHPGWRQTYPSDRGFTVVEAPDGHHSIIPVN